MVVITVLDRDNLPLGPFTPEEVREKLRSGDFTLDDMAFMEGLANWTPLRQVLSRASGMTRPPAPPVDAALRGIVSGRHFAYGGFGQRVLAFLLDGVIVGVPVVTVDIGLTMLFRSYGYIPAIPPQTIQSLWLDPHQQSYIEFESALVLFYLVVSWLYSAIMESSSLQATIGKQTMKLKVVNLKGKRIGFIRATLRFFCKKLCTWVCCLGLVPAAFTQRSQGLHDMIAGTLVVRE